MERLDSLASQRWPGALQRSGSANGGSEQEDGEPAAARNGGSRIGKTGSDQRSTHRRRLRNDRVWEICLGLSRNPERLGGKSSDLGGFHIQA